MIHVNGIERIGTPQTLQALLDEMGIDQRGVALAVDGEIALRSSWSTFEPADGAVIEIVTAAAGG